MVYQGIRRNDESDLRGNKENQLCGEDGGRNFKPLRYTPGLKCDAHLESLRPERSNHHQAFTGPEQYGWRKKLIQPQETYEGSFADADLEKFRPEPKKTVSRNLILSCMLLLLLSLLLLPLLALAEGRNWKRIAKCD